MSLHFLHAYVTVFVGLLCEVCAFTSTTTEILQGNHTFSEVENENNEQMSGSPYWLRLAVILFCVLTVVCVSVAVAFGIFKRRQYAKRHGLYKKNNQVDRRGSTETFGPDYEMFTAVDPQTTEIDIRSSQ